eukprot:SAG22_NODE_606_length_8615_cov_6.190348_10_plen_250_part_00
MLTTPGTKSCVFLMIEWVHALVLHAPSAARAGPNEAIYVPDAWFHATLSIGHGVSLASFIASKAPLFRGVAAAEPYVQRQDWPKCAATAKRITQKFPHTFIGWLYWGFCSFQQTQTQPHHASLLPEAMSALEKCVELNPLFAPCHTWLGRAYAAAGKNRRASRHRKRALTLSWPGDDSMCVSCKAGDPKVSALPAHEQLQQMLNHRAAMLAGQVDEVIVKQMPLEQVDETIARIHVQEYLANFPDDLHT